MQPSARVILLLLLVGTSLGCSSTAQPDREPIVGLPCEGCEAVFDGLSRDLASRSAIAPENEPGERMRLAGTVFSPNGRPAAGIVVYAYHTDAKGIYPRSESGASAAARRHGRLRGWAKTNMEGSYQFDTIRPASYPNTSQPAHVHMHVLEVGRCTYYIDPIHFDDDLLLSQELRREMAAGRGGSGLVHPRRDPDGTWVVSRDIRLGENVPGYPTWPESGEPAVSQQGPERLDVTQLDDAFLVTEPEWSRDGTRITFAAGAWPDLDVFVLDVTRGDVVRLFRSGATDYVPSFSPDGEQLVFASNRAGSYDLYVGSSSGGAAVRVTEEDAFDDTEPRWSPDGNWIAFRSDRDGNREVHRVRPDGSNRERLTRHDADDGEPSWSPDSRRLLFTSLRDGQPEIYQMEADGSSRPVRLTVTPGGHSRRAEWSPDGSWLSFGSNREGNEELYLMRTDSSEVRNVSRHPAREYYSRWSPDGQSLLFTSNRDRAKNAIYRMSLDGSRIELVFPAAAQPADVADRPSSDR